MCTYEYTETVWETGGELSGEVQGGEKWWRRIGTREKQRERNIFKNTLLSILIKYGNIMKQNALKPSSALVVTMRMRSIHIMPKPGKETHKHNAKVTASLIGLAKEHSRAISTKSSCKEQKGCIHRWSLTFSNPNQLYTFEEFFFSKRVKPHSRKWACNANM